MKKATLIVFVSVMSILLIGCGKKEITENIPSPTETTGQVILSSTSWTMCANAVKDYLAKADTKGKSGKTVKKWHKITVHYIGRLDEETVFDTSIEEIAKACGKYMTGRNYNEGLGFEVGAGQMIAGFDQGVEGMSIWQTKTIYIEAKDAYGERSETNVIKVPREQIPDTDKIEKWMKLMSSNGQGFTVIAVDDKEVSLDANHELAGKSLIFDITVQSIQE